MAAPGLCPPRAGLVHYQLQVLVITRQAQIGIKCGACVAKPSSSPLHKSWGLGAKSCQVNLKGKERQRGRSWGPMILETLVFIFPPGSLGSRSGQGRIPQESQLWSGLSEATCLCSPSDILKCFSNISGPPPKLLNVSVEGSPTGPSSECQSIPQQLLHASGGAMFTWAS